MKCKSSIRRRCQNCKVVIRRGVRRIICSTKKHTQKQG
ncbi:MAG: 50S ribosomal protein L36 [Candidatus Shapirobacteria bacterium]|nr:50S ribosomal protein L36 [Candidatus Shapirobacteria bacterium]